MNKNSRRMGFFILLMTLISAAAVTLRTLACINNMEDGVIYYGDETLAFISTVVVTAGAILLLLSAAVFHKAPLKATFSSPLTYIPTGAVCVALAAFISVPLKTVLSYTSYLRLIFAIREPLFLLNIAIVIFTVLSAVHFILTAILTDRHRSVRACFALGTILLACFYTASMYFDPTMPINSPTEIIDEMAYLSVAIFFLYEARISLGREMWRGYCAFGLVAALLTAYASIPELLVYFIEGKTLAENIESSILLFTVFIFIFARLILAASTVEDGEHSAIGVLREFAEKREAELTEASKQRRGADDIQISIDDILGEPVEDIRVEIDGAHAEETDSESDAGAEAMTEEAGN